MNEKASDRSLESDVTVYVLLETTKAINSAKSSELSDPSRKFPDRVLLYYRTASFSRKDSENRFRPLSIVLSYIKDPAVSKHVHC